MSHYGTGDRAFASDCLGSGDPDHKPKLWTGPAALLRVAIMNKSSCTQFANAAGTATGALTAASITCQAAQSDQATIFELRRVIYVVDARWRHSSLWISCAPSFAVVQYKAIIADRLLTAEDAAKDTKAKVMQPYQSWLVARVPQVQAAAAVPAL